jgi:hypothetical protein
LKRLEEKRQIANFEQKKRQIYSKVNAKSEHLTKKPNFNIQKTPTCNISKISKKTPKFTQIKATSKAARSWSKSAKSREAVPKSPGKQCVK